ncbi:MAG TPA: RpiB/LacA/LacB family sugar-phosphate isomerase [Solirubrobacteraceae bacterium]|jgi:ribose 5-phosphate isomerase B|nr:RpiB/LacA/LacB family sugar-phosphate isomerase [Solirubrobacteraceae bacterium]
MRIACAFDHAGVPLHDTVIDALRADGHEPVDLGADDDYPDTAVRAGRALRAGEAQRAVLVCGSGAGVAVAASKMAGVRAAVAHETYTAHQCVEHDDCNVLCLGARVVGPALATEVVRAFAAASFSGEERHVRRLSKIEQIEREENQRP